MKTVVRINLIISLMLIFQSVIGQTYTIPWAQQQPTWVFPIWFEDGNGELDTIFMCYDPLADNGGLSGDTVFGEKYVEIDTSKFGVFIEESGAFGFKALVYAGLGAGLIEFEKAKLPLTMKWDKNLFYDPILLQIPIADQLPFPLFQINLFCGDFDPSSYDNCPDNFPLYLVPEDPIFCCPGGILTDSFKFVGDAIGPLSFMNTDYSLQFLEFQPFVGIEDINHRGKISFYPNPFENTIQVRNELEEYVNLELVDIMGRSLLHLTIPRGISALSLSHIIPGIYHINIKSNNNYFSKTIQKI